MPVSDSQRLPASCNEPRRREGTRIRKNGVTCWNTTNFLRSSTVGGLLQMAFTEATNGCGDRISRQSGLGEETYGGACLEHVGQVRLRVCRYQYYPGRSLVIALLK